MAPSCGLISLPRASAPALRGPRGWLRSGTRRPSSSPGSQRSPASRPRAGSRSTVRPAQPDRSTVTLETSVAQALACPQTSTTRRSGPAVKLVTVTAADASAVASSRSTCSPSPTKPANVGQEVVDVVRREDGGEVTVGLDAAGGCAADLAVEALGVLDLVPELKDDLRRPVADPWQPLDEVDAGPERRLERGAPPGELHRLPVRLPARGLEHHGAPRGQRLGEQRPGGPRPASPSSLRPLPRRRRRAPAPRRPPSGPGAGSVLSRRRGGGPGGARG